MAAPLVVHLGAPAATARRLVGSADGALRHVADVDPGRADVVVLHGRAGRRAARLRPLRALVVRRPAAGERPTSADRRPLAWTDLVVVADTGEVEPWRAAIDRPGRAVEVLPDDDPAAWTALLATALGPTAGVIERALGDDLLLAPVVPTGEVERLTGSGPAIWAQLRAGRTPAEVAEAVRPGDPEALAAVAAFADDLVHRGLAGPA